MEGPTESFLSEDIKHLNPYQLKLFSGTANPELAQEIANKLGVPVGKLAISRFSDGEIYVKIGESVRGNDVYLVQPTCPPTNEHIMELMILIDAFRRASCHEITVIVPYFGYARQDRKNQGREAITAKLVADLISTSGADRVITFELHAGQIQGFFNIPVDNLYSSPAMVKYLVKKNLEDVVVVSPDIGGVARARAFAKKINAPLAIIDKRRSGHNQAEVMNIIGEIKDKTVVLYDDIVDTAGTLCAGAKLLKEKGAKEIYTMATHGVLSGNAIENINNSPIKEVLITNSIPLKDKKSRDTHDKIKVISIAEIISEAIRCIDTRESVSKLFD